MKEYKSSRFCSSVCNILNNCLQFNMEISVVDKSNIERKSLTTKNPVEVKFELNGCIPCSFIC